VAATARLHVSIRVTLLVSSAVVAGLGVALLALAVKFSDEGPIGGLPDLHRPAHPLTRRWI
jgi:hypothetical protein